MKRWLFSAKHWIDGLVRNSWTILVVSVLAVMTYPYLSFPLWTLVVAMYPLAFAFGWSDGVLNDLDGLRYTPVDVAMPPQRKDVLGVILYEDGPDVAMVYHVDGAWKYQLDDGPAEVVGWRYAMAVDALYYQMREAA